VRQELSSGATDFTLLNLPRAIDDEEADQPNLFYDSLNPKLLLLLRLGVGTDHTQVLRTADLPDLGWDVVGDKVAPNTVPPATPQHPIITVKRRGPGDYELIVLEH
jgi:hypothetical protein